jgi:UDP-2-acetamido-3-amino-2,3-dideoxy-glucuronate N-acetyltransferase
MSEVPYFAHDTAVVELPCQIGVGTKIWHFSHIMRSCVIAERCNVGPNVVVSPDWRIGNGCKI